MEDLILAYVAELHTAGFTQLRDGGVCGLRLNEHLAQGHFLTSEHVPHLGDCLRSLWMKQIEGGNKGLVSTFNIRIPQTSN